ncbi:hypothetical protein V502_03597 [Pseudogymnoascus sp. VKM F-4520 (FW-2644)]|nr:hypothetical protein V502_03597 [Pseudogymnoascus sp. VKM F-4520 (FW-2644)]
MSDTERLVCGGDVESIAKYRTEPPRTPSPRRPDEGQYTNRCFALPYYETQPNLSLRSATAIIPNRVFRREKNSQALLGEAGRTVASLPARHARVRQGRPEPEADGTQIPPMYGNDRHGQEDARSNHAKYDGIAT